MALYKHVPVQILVAAFTDENAAETALKEIAKAEDSPIVCNAAIATKNVDGKTKVKEYGKPSFLSGMVGGGAIGGTIGAVVGGAALALFGPVGVTAGAIAGGAVGAPLGAALGAVIGTVGKLTTEGMDKNKLKGLGNTLEPGTSALVLVFAKVKLKKGVLEENEELKVVKQGTDTIANLITEDISKNLKAGNNCATLFAITEDGVVLIKAVRGVGVEKLMAMVLTDDGVVVAGATKTEEGTAVGVVIATDDGIFAGGAVVTDNVVAYEVVAEE